MHNRLDNFGLKNRQIRMNVSVNDLSPGNCSSIQIEISVNEKWIERILFEKEVVIPVNENIHLINLRIKFDSGMLLIKADILEKDHSGLEIAVMPLWDAATQSLRIENLDIKTKSSNLLLKGAGFLAQFFLNEKLDRKIEEQVNKLLSDQLGKLKKEPVRIPIPKGGFAQASISDIRVHEMVFIDDAARIKATIDAHWILMLE
jgi:hypothetical protein